MIRAPALWLLTCSAGCGFWSYSIQLLYLLAFNLLFWFRLCLLSKLGSFCLMVYVLLTSGSHPSGLFISVFVFRFASSLWLTLLAFLLMFLAVFLIWELSGFSSLACMWDGHQLYHVKSHTTLSNAMKVARALCQCFVLPTLRYMSAHRSLIEFGWVSRDWRGKSHTWRSVP